MKLIIILIPPPAVSLCGCGDSYNTAERKFGHGCFYRNYCEYITIILIKESSD